MGSAVNPNRWLLAFSYVGSAFVFGTLGERSTDPTHFYFAFQVLPNIIFASALIAVFHYYGVTWFLIRHLAHFMRRFFNASGAETLNVAATIFIGQTEAPLTVRAFLPDMTRSELMTVMTSGMAHVSGGMIAAYVALGIDAGHLLTAVLMTAPGSILLAKMLVPETESPITGGVFEDSKLTSTMMRKANLWGAIVQGTTDGLKLAVSIGAMVIAFIALVAVVNGLLSQIHDSLLLIGFANFPKDMQSILGPLLRPVAWLIGVQWADCAVVGNLLGTKIILNELISYAQLSALKGSIDARSFTISTFALCGFANLSSIGIQVGGIGALAPNKVDDLARLGFRAMLAGTMANLLSACVAGLLL
jgi:CNT family concentrative nucleoside transporter